MMAITPLENALDMLRTIAADTHGSSDEMEQRINRCASIGLDGFRQTQTKPRDYSMVEVLTASNETHIIGYSNERGFFEPITNQDAESCIGPIIGWKYES